MKTVGHGSRFSPWPASLARSLTPLLVDPPGFDREEKLPPVYWAIAAFLGAWCGVRCTLGPPLPDRMSRLPGQSRVQ